ncbi:unnamed protein product [Anisakis simplex]|uniref:Uncharacterized protein n=1 Tax=Anisakis simplex TaxID=6269 RepID=A0A0M3JLX0_ANISI|nr:unnamed protein product [Anisakis simplex]
MTVFQAIGRYSNGLPAQRLDDIVRYSSSTAIRLKKLERGAEDCGLDPGAHDFHFTMQLPKRGLYTSFEQLDCCACVRYFIMVSDFLKSFSHLIVSVNLTTIITD